MSAAVSTPKRLLHSGPHDSAKRRRGKRAGAERGIWVYIVGEQLEALGFSVDDPPPYYRTWETSDGRPRLVVNLYREP